MWRVTGVTEVCKFFYKSLLRVRNTMLIHCCFSRFVFFIHQDILFGNQTCATCTMMRGKAVRNSLRLNCQMSILVSLQIFEV